MLAEVAVIARTAGHILVGLWWFILLAIIIASVMSTLRLDRKVAQFLHRVGMLSIVGALLLGIVSPLWAIGVLPVVAAMLAGGAPVAPVMVFLISSPLMSPSAFFVTLGGLGMSIALWKLFSAVALGLAAGCVTNWLWERQYLGKSILRVETEPQDQEEHISRFKPDSDAPITCEPVVAEKYGLSFLRSIGKNSIFIGKFIIIAVIAQALMVRYVPQDWVVAAVGTKQSYSVFISTVIGIPAYINSISAVPLLKGLMDLGMDKGAVLAFIIAGPVMSVPSILAVMALFRRQALYIYVIVGFIGALAFGYTFRLF